MAEAILKYNLHNTHQVESAGIYAFPGQSISDNADYVLKKNNISHIHTSRLLTQDLIEHADLVLTMTSNHKNASLSIINDLNKIFTITEYVGEDNQFDIIDPYGGDVGIYEATFKQLSILIDKLIKVLNEGKS
jgi:protein-tyrosine phosphatase